MRACRWRCDDVGPRPSLRGVWARQRQMIQSTSRDPCPTLPQQGLPLLRLDLFPPAILGCLLLCLLGFSFVFGLCPDFCDIATWWAYDVGVDFLLEPRGCGGGGCRRRRCSCCCCCRSFVLFCYEGQTNNTVSVIFPLHFLLVMFV